MAIRSLEGADGNSCRSLLLLAAVLLLGAEHAVDLGPAHRTRSLGGPAAVGHLHLFALEVPLLATFHAVSVETGHSLRYSLLGDGTTCRPRRSALSRRT